MKYDHQNKAAMRLQTLSMILFFFALSVLPLRRAIDVASPPKTEGTGDLNATELTPLQKHVSFFDRNKDGLIFPKETFQGMRAIGVNTGIAVAGAALIHAALSPVTRPPGKSQSPLLPIYVENISKGKHGSDTDTYDSEGRFVLEKFEEIFTKYAKTNPNALSSEELDAMIQGNQDQNDTKGHLGSQSEWKLLFDLAKDKDGFLQKDTVRGVYDGSLFYKLEQDKSFSKYKS